MSHFSTLVLTDDVDKLEELLAPYDESIEVEPYVYKTKEQIIIDGKKIKEELLKNPPKDITPYYKAIMESKTDEELYDAICYEDDEYNENGDSITTYNPKSKWDWWSLGGRWSNSLKTKDGDLVNIVQLKDLDISINHVKYSNAIRFWEVFVEDAPLKKHEKKEDFFSFYKKEYYIERYDSKETYALLASTFCTFAVVTPDGQWHEQGEMGFFGMDSSNGNDEKSWKLNYKENFIDKYPPDTFAIMVDCHI